MSELPDPSSFPPPTDPNEQIALEAAQGVPMFIIAKGQNVGQIGSAEDLASKFPGQETLAEGASYDPAVYPDLARFLKPYYGEGRVPALSRPEWL